MERQVDGAAAAGMANAAEAVTKEAGKVRERVAGPAVARAEVAALLEATRVGAARAVAVLAAMVATGADALVRPAVARAAAEA